MKIQVSKLENLVKRALKNQGYNPKEIRIIKDVLMYAQLRGNNQGIVKLIGKGIPRRSEGTSPEIVKKTPSSFLVNGNKIHAMVAMKYITDLAIKKAKKSGIAVAGSFNTEESTGALGYYVSKIAREGLIGFAFSSSPFQTTAPYGSNEARFCTNPLAYGIPTSSDPIIFDMTTSAMAYYGLIEAKTAGKQVSEGIGYDSEGTPTTDPVKIMGGALNTVAGHKGSGLALLVQALAGSLITADSFNNDSDNSGNLVIAINPEIFRPLDEFKTDMESMKSKIKSARKLPGVPEILLPGERGNRLTQHNLDSGDIEVEDNLLKQLKEAAK